jgi:hypothetical protein
VSDAAFGYDWVGIPIPIQRCKTCIIAAANEEFQLTAGKFVSVSNVTMINVCSRVKLLVTNNIYNVYSDIRQKVIFFVILYWNEAKLPRGFMCDNIRARIYNVIKYQQNTRL